MLGAFHLRLVGKGPEIYQYLEPLYNDYRKIRIHNSDGTYSLTHVDELIDQLLRSDAVFDTTLPRIPYR